jgi:hypothetical protein
VSIYVDVKIISKRTAPYIRARVYCFLIRFFKDKNERKIKSKLQAPK